MLAKPHEIIDRDLEWSALERFVERRGKLAIVYGPRRIGKSFLLDGLCKAAGGWRHQAVAGSPAVQLDDFARGLGQRLGAGTLRLDGWADALERLGRLNLPFVAIDELSYLTEAVPELTSVIQRYIDTGTGPPLILSGSSLSVMRELLLARAPLYGRASAVVVPAPFKGADLAALWQAEDPLSALWIDASVGGMPGYRPLLDPPGEDLESWMVREVLAAGSPLLDAAEADLAESTAPASLRGVHRSILTAIANGQRTFGAIARVAGVPTGALTRPLSALQRAGLIERVSDPLRRRRDRYELADPHLRMWLSMIAPNRSLLQAGSAAELWPKLAQSTWRSQVLGPRWETVVRDHIAHGGNDLIGAPDVVGTTTVADRALRRSHEVDLLAIRNGKIIAIGEAKLRALGMADLDRLRHIRGLLGAPEAALLLASAAAIEPSLTARLEDKVDLIEILPSDIYGMP